MAYKNHVFNNSGEKHPSYKNGSAKGYRWKLTRCVLSGNPRCGECGTKDRLIVHHKDGNVRNNNISNLFVMCRSCHRAYHGFKRRKYANAQECRKAYLERKRSERIESMRLFAQKQWGTDTYLTTPQLAAKFGVSGTRIQQLREERRLIGTPAQLGNRWFYPPTCSRR